MLQVCHCHQVSLAPLLSCVVPACLPPVCLTAFPFLFLPSLRRSVLIFEATEPGFPADQAVRIFVQFARVEEATKVGALALVV